MKKWSLLCCCLLLALVLAGCGLSALLSGGGQGAVKAQPRDVIALWGGEETKQQAEQFLELLMGGRYYVEGETYALGMVVQTSYVYDGDDHDLRGMMWEKSFRELHLDGQSYELDEQRQTYRQSGSRRAHTDHSGLAWQSSGSGAVPLLEERPDCDYEQYYRAKSEEGVGELLLRFYFQQQRLYAIYSESGGVGVTLLPELLSDQLPEGRLEVPEDYQLVE